jgi:exonuclease III
MNSASKIFLLLSWNVCGLGDRNKCTIVRDVLRQATPTIICLQETKLTDCSIFKATTFLPLNMSSSFVLSNASGSRGGMLTAWDNNSLSLESSSVPNAYCLSTTFSSNMSEHTFSVTNVYAPSDHRDSATFLS